MRAIWISAVAVVVVVAVCILLGSLWVGSYIRGGDFRALVSGATGQAMGGKADIAALQWTGASVYSERVGLQGSPGAGLRTLEASQVRAEVNWRALLGGAWRVDRISIAKLSGEWGPSVETPTARTVASKSPAGLSALLPHRFELGDVRIASAELSYEGSKLAGSSLTITPDGAGWVFAGSGGTLSVPWSPRFDVGSFRARQQGGVFYLLGGDLRLGAKGKVKVSGDTASGGRVEVAWEAVDARDILPGDWKGRLEGTLEGTASARLVGDSEGYVQLTEGRLERVPLLDTVADFTANPAFRRMALQHVSGNFSMKEGELAVTNFVGESKGLMRVVGRFSVSRSGRLDGHLEVGVTAQTLQWIPGSRERVFSTSRDGYLWAPLKLGGTVEKPTEDLTPRLVRAMGEEAIEQGTKLIKDPTGTAVEGARSVLDMLRPLVP